MGDIGVQSLFVRSAKLTPGKFGGVAEISILEGSAKLRGHLFGTFLALLTTFIGERLVTQVLRRAWPTIEAAAPRENT